MHMVENSNLGLNIYTVSFFGHRILEAPIMIEQHLEPLIRRLLKEKAYVEFLVGRDGEFDLLVASVIRRCKRNLRDDNSALIWVLPYPTAEFRDNEIDFRQYYDDIEIYDSVAASHFRGAHQARNRAMVDRSNLVVFCVQHTQGGAWQTMNYAKRHHIPHINLHDFSRDKW